MLRRTRLFAALAGTCAGAFLSIGVSVAQEPVLSNLALLDTLTRKAVDRAVDSLHLPDGEPVTVLCTYPHEGNDFVKKILAQALAERGYSVKILRTEGEMADTVAVENPTPPNRPGAASAPSRPAAGAPGAGTDPESEETPEEVTGAAAMDESEAVSEPPSLIPVDPQSVPAGALLSSGAYPTGRVLDLEILDFGVRYSEAGRRLLVGSVNFTRVAGAYLRIAHLMGPSGEMVEMANGEEHHWDRLGSRQKLLAEGASYPFTAPELKAPGVGQYVEPAVVVGIVGSLIYLFYTNQN